MIGTSATNCGPKPLMVACVSSTRTPTTVVNFLPARVPANSDSKYPPDTFSRTSESLILGGAKVNAGFVRRCCAVIALNNVAASNVSHSVGRGFEPLTPERKLLPASNTPIVTPGGDGKL